MTPHTVKRYIEIFEALYIVFRVTPYSKNIARSILKEPKIYFYDTGMVLGDDGIKFENHVAMSLLKDLKVHEDMTGKQSSLNYIRTKDDKEIDFCRVINGEVLDAIEVKLADDNVSKNLIYFKERYPYKIKQVVKNLRLERLENEIEVLSGFNFLKSSLALNSVSS